MFNFHKPRVYRSADGCCICRAKSSSSRFTASRKYEKESVLCFNLTQPRNGEICNACVLLVKRFKRLPAGSKRHWGHVVDARAGPGTKSLAKQKQKRDQQQESGGETVHVPEKFAKIFKKNRKGKVVAANAGKLPLPPPANNSPQPSDSNESYDEDQAQSPTPTSVAQMPPQQPYQTRKRTAAAALAATNTDNAPINMLNQPPPPKILVGSKRRCLMAPQKNRRAVDNVPFFEEQDLVRLNVCCGVVFQSLSLGSYCCIIDPELYRPCEKHLSMRIANKKQLTEMETEQPKIININQPTPPTSTTASSTSSAASSSSAAANLTASIQPVTVTTQALKKHHLFFKRQSESFPQGDINRISPIPLNKTEEHSKSIAIAPPPPTPPTTTAAAATAATTIEEAVVVDLKTTTALGAASPSSLSSSSNCSTSSSVATKFGSDNSSDSGFDEHERKSISPQLPRLILSNGMTIVGQSSNLMLAATEFASRYAATTTAAPSRQITEITAAAASGALKGSATTLINPSMAAMNTLKINLIGSQGKGSSSSSSSSSVSPTVVSTTSVNNPATVAAAAGGGGGGGGTRSNKLRAIFNQSNAIQHENGVTTILPASSLAATNQAAAMNAIAPSTVTITPSASSALAASAVSAGGVAKKLNATAGAATLRNANPKFILLKSTSTVMTKLSATPVAAITTGNNNNISTTESKII